MDMRITYSYWTLTGKQKTSSTLRWYSLWKIPLRCKYPTFPNHNADVTCGKWEPLQLFNDYTQPRFFSPLFTLDFQLLLQTLAFRNSTLAVLVRDSHFSVPISWDESEPFSWLRTQFFRLWERKKKGHLYIKLLQQLITNQSPSRLY